MLHNMRLATVSWKKSLRLSIENEYPPSKCQKLSNSCFEDLPDEVILRVFINLDIKNLIRCGHVSKRIRAISQDESLWLKINLYSLGNLSRGIFNWSGAA